MEPDDIEFGWETVVSRVYSEVVAAADPDEGIGRTEAMAIAGERLLAMIDDGDVKPDMEDAVKRALLQADKSHGKRADRIIEDTRSGRLTLFDAEPELNTVVILGDGRRKVWRHVNEDDLIAMDQVRYRNLVNAQDAYRRWRNAFDATRPAVRVHGTVEKAIAAGAFADASSIEQGG